MYPCEAEHDSELSFQVGAIFNAGKCYRLHQSLRTGPGILDSAAEKGKKNRTPQSGLQSKGEMRGEASEQEGKQEALQ